MKILFLYSLTQVILHKALIVSTEGMVSYIVVCVCRIESWVDAAHVLRHAN